MANSDPENFFSFKLIVDYTYDVLSNQYVVPNVVKSATPQLEDELEVATFPLSWAATFDGNTIHDTIEGTSIKVVNGRLRMAKDLVTSGISVYLQRDDGYHKFQSGSEVTINPPRLRIAAKQGVVVISAEGDPFQGFVVESAPTVNSQQWDVIGYGVLKPLSIWKMEIPSNGTGFNKISPFILSNSQRVSLMSGPH
jgi:hypothetical protein